MAPSAGVSGRLHPEARLTALFLLVCFFTVGLPRIFTNTAAFAIFLNVYGAEFLPYTYIGAAVAAPAVGSAYLWLQGRLSLRTLLLAALLFDLTALVALRLALMLTDMAWLAMAAAIWVEVEWMLVSLVFWGLAERAFDIRAAKRLFGVIGSGEPLAMILGGLAVPVLLTAVDTADLFWFSAVGLAVGTALILHITGAHGERLAGDDGGTADEEEGETSVGGHRSGSRRTSRYIALLFTLVVLGEMAYFFVDNAFYDRAEATFPDEAELAGFIGVFYALAAVVTFAGNLFAAGHVLRRYGVQVGLLILPVLLIASSLGVVIAGLAFGATALLFWLTSLTKLVDEGVRGGIYKPALMTLYQPLPPDQRTRVQTWVEGFCEQLGAGAAGLILLAMTGVLGIGVVGLFAAVVVILLACIALLLGLHRQYMVVLRQAVAKRRFSAETLSIRDDETLEVVKRGLASRRPGEVLYCMRLLESAGHRPLEPLFVPLLDHPAPEIRCEALGQIERGRLRDAQGALQARLLVEQDPRVKGAAVRALAALGETESVDVVVNYVADADDVVRIGALTGLMIYGGIEGVVAVGERFMAMVRSTDPRERRVATRVLEELGSRRFYRPLLTMLDDPDPEVRRAALRAAGTVNAPQLWPLLCEALRSRAVGQAAAAALVSAGRGALPLLEELFARADSGGELRGRIAWIYGRIGGPDAAALLEAKLDVADPKLQHRVLAALRRCGVRGTPANRDALWRVVRRTVDRAAWASATLAGLDGGGEATGLLRRALEQELLRCQERIFLALSFFHDQETLTQAWQQFTRGTPDKRAYALEIVDTLLSPEFRALVMPVLEPPPEWRTARPGGSPHSRPGLAPRLAALVRNEAGLASPWVRCCALYGIARLAERRRFAGVPRLTDAVAAALRADEPLVRETAAWALSRLRPADLRERLEPLALDAADEVAPVARRLLRDAAAR
ncbi:MAG TPA: Npt1/Npt2 family nucleotide transporter [Geminicoccaceae bacterium]|nr:Npt1/Npt2 family nucleotide transporter [Geminicoccaceae bacterium]